MLDWHNVILYSNEKEWTDDILYNIDDYHGYYVEQKRLDIKEYMLHNSIYMLLKNWQKQIYHNKGHNSGCLQVRGFYWLERGMKKASGLL